MINPFFPHFWRRGGYFFHLHHLFAWSFSNEAHHEFQKKNMAFDTQKKTNMDPRKSLEVKMCATLVASAKILQDLCQFHLYPTSSAP